MGVKGDNYPTRYGDLPVIKIFTKESIPAPPIPETILPATTTDKDWPTALGFGISIAIDMIPEGIIGRISVTHQIALDLLLAFSIMQQRCYSPANSKDTIRDQDHSPATIYIAKFDVL